MSPLTKVKLKLFIFNLLFDLTMFLIIGFCAYFNHKIKETVLFYIAWINLRYVFPKVFHFKQSRKPILNVLGCLVCSALIFIFTIPHIAPLHISLFSSITISAFINFLLYKIQCYLDYKDFYIKHTKFSVETATTEQIENLGKILHYKRDKIELAKKFFVEKLSNRQVLEWLCENQLDVEYDTVIQYRYRILKDIKKFEKF